MNVLIGVSEGLTSIFAELQDKARGVIQDALRLKEMCLSMELFMICNEMLFLNRGIIMKFFKSELLVNILIFILGICLDLIAVLFKLNTSKAPAIILFSIGSSLIASAIVALLSFLYRIKEKNISEMVNEIGLEKIIIGDDSFKSLIDKTIKSAKREISISLFNPFFIDLKILKEKECGRVNIRWLLEKTSENYNTITELEKGLLLENKLRVKQYNGILKGIIICDDIVMVFQGERFTYEIAQDIKMSPTIFVYRRNSDNSLYNMYIEEFERKWNLAEDIEEK